MTPEALFPPHVAAAIDVTPQGCWRWTGRHTPDGYARVSAGPWKLGHRYAWSCAGRTLPDGMQLDHLCRVRDCLNPAHMEPVTRGTNLARRGLPPHARVYAP